MRRALALALFACAGGDDKGPDTSISALDIALEPVGSPTPLVWRLTVHATDAVSLSARPARDGSDGAASRLAGSSVLGRAEAAKRPGEAAVEPEFGRRFQQARARQVVEAGGRLERLAGAAPDGLFDLGDDGVR